MVLTEGGDATASYTYGNALIRKDGETPLFDGLGSERTVTDFTGSVTASQTTSAFGGAVASSGGSTSSYQWGATSGYRTDGDGAASGLAGLVKVGCRDYDTDTGRFTSLEAAPTGASGERRTLLFAKTNCFLTDKRGICYRKGMTTALRPARVEVGASAPDAALTGTDGNPVALAAYWRRQPVVLVFLRHLGCTFCRAQVAELRRDYAKFRALGVEIVCIAQGDAQTGKAFSIFFDLPYPLLLSGDDTDVYRAYGLERGTLGQLFGLRSWTRGLTATLQGHLIGKRIGDGFQMPGVFIIDAQGIIRYAHRHKDATDNPETQELLAAARSLTGDNT